MSDLKQNHRVHSGSIKNYEIKSGNYWYPVRGVVTKQGWLDWIDKNGCLGLTRPGRFREREPKKNATVTQAK